MVKLVRPTLRRSRSDEFYGPFICRRCNNVWSGRTLNPKQCPECKSPYWNRSRGKSSNTSIEDIY